MVHISTPPPPRHVGMVKLPPPPNASPIVPPVVDSTNDGVVFWHSVSRRNPNVSAYYNITLCNAYVAILMVNGRPING